MVFSFKARLQLQFDFSVQSEMPCHHAWISYAAKEGHEHTLDQF